MIPIKHKDLEVLAQRHFEAIRNYIDEKPQKGKKKYDMQYFNNAIQKYFPDYNLEKIILASPKELDDLAAFWDIWLVKKHNDFEGFLTYYGYLTNKDNNKQYRFFTKKNKKNEIEFEKEPYSSISLINHLNISVCPYCNRNFIKSVGEKRIDELDHFYPKKKYPFLAVSFYNLIPSCKICNQTFKNDREISVNPYNIYRHGQFKFKIKNVQFYYDENGFDIDFSELKKSLYTNIDVLGLEKLYPQHKDYILNLIQKSITYNDSYIDELLQTYKGTLFRNREDVLRLVTANYLSEDDFDKRPLAKLTHDIAKELGLLP